MLSSELETLDQLLGGDMTLKVIATLYSTAEQFQKGLLGLLSSGDVVLMDGGSEVPHWRWQEIVAGNLNSYPFYVRITAEGVKRLE